MAGNKYIEAFRARRAPAAVPVAAPDPAPPADPPVDPVPPEPTLAELEALTAPEPPKRRRRKAEDQGGDAPAE